MNRRKFLQTAGATLILPVLPGGLPRAHAAAPLPLTQRMLAYIGLYGGPDFRHLCPPVITGITDSQSYAFQFWQARASSFGIPANQRNLAGYVAHFNANYTAVNKPGTLIPSGFGLLKKAGWLISMWNGGYVALICNTIGTDSRDHAHAQLVLDHGDRTTLATDRLKPGWGGRLVDALGGNARLAALTNSPRPFCYGPLAGSPTLHQNSRVISVKNSRDLHLAEFRLEEQVGKEMWGRNVLTRSLKSYYAAHTAKNPRYQQFKDHEFKMRTFGNQLYTRLGDEVTGNIPVPSAIRQLYRSPASGQPDLRLYESYFGEQTRNLYDVIASADILGLRVAAMEYSRWDTHQTQSVEIEENYTDLFGAGRSLASLYAGMPIQTQDNLVLTLAGEFGRQLAANGDNGTDHGVGNIVVVIGTRVRGGVYGDMFPAGELTPVNKFTRTWGDDSEGLTGFEHVFGAVADWVAGGTVDIFPGRASAPLEAGVNLSGLFL